MYVSELFVSIIRSGIEMVKSDLKSAIKSQRFTGKFKCLLSWGFIEHLIVFIVITNWISVGNFIFMFIVQVCFMTLRYIRLIVNERSAKDGF